MGRVKQRIHLDHGGYYSMESIDGLRNDPVSEQAHFFHFCFDEVARLEPSWFQTAASC